MNRVFPPLVDTYGRTHTSLRISVTDACNIRCRYCMPAVVNGFLPQSNLMSFDAIERVVRTLANAGLRKVRLTGGEPLMRPKLEELVAKISRIDGIDQIALTTNGMLLPQSMQRLVEAGMTHVNISLDTLREEAFQKISRRDGIDQVLLGIEAALCSKLHVRLNALIMRDINLEDVVSLVRFARDKDVFIRFIEFMPLDAEKQWSRDQVVAGRELRVILERHFGPMIPIQRKDPAQPASDFGFEDGLGGVGFIDPVSQPFCGQCNRLRLTADGKFRNCLFGREEWDVRVACERNASDEELYEIAAACVQKKYASHGISSSNFQQPERAMYQIGG